MKKNKVLLLTALVILFFFAFAACDNGNTEETTETPANTTVETNEPVGNETEGSEKETEKITESEKVTESETVIQTETETEPHTHVFSEWKTVKAATCTAKGEQERNCACGEKETQGLDMLAHTEVIDNAVEATCTETGLTEGLHCEICKAVLVQQKTVAVIDHVESDWIIDNEATKTEDGKKHTECTMCKKVMKEEIAYAIGSLGLAYTVNEDGTTCTVTGMGTCTDTEVFISGMIDNYKVTAIADKAFAEVSGVTKIVLLNGVQTIGTRAFYSCTDLEEITISETVTSIGTQVFYKCDKLATVYYNSPYSNGENKFMNLANITKVVFGGAKIPTSILSGCANVKEIVITDSITSIGDDAFYACSGLEKVYFTGDISAWLKLSLWNTPMQYADKLYISGELVTDVVIPDGVTTICSYAFYNCSSLTSITIPDSVTSIGYRTFYGCSSLESITIPNSVAQIDSYAFENCLGLKKVYYSGDVNDWLNINFGILSATPMYYADEFYVNNNLATEIIIPDNITKIGDFTFYGFESITKFIIPDSVTMIGNYAFTGCSNWSGDVVIPYGVTEVKQAAFSNCANLTSITIPVSVTKICNSAFYKCSNLNTIMFGGTVEQWNAIAFQTYWNDGVPATTVICSDGFVALK